MYLSKNPEDILKEIFHALFEFYGPQHWWPAESSFEIMIGAILTQNTNWRNVELAICNLKKSDLLEPLTIKNVPISKLRKLIKPAGFYNVKAKRVKTFVQYLIKDYAGNLEKMKRKQTSILRRELLAIKGIGSETCDSILLYALKKPVFVIDAYTRRILMRHNFIDEKDSYREIQTFFERNLKKDVRLFNEYHALLVRLAKEKCKSSKPLCDNCPIGEICT